MRRIEDLVGVHRDELRAVGGKGSLLYRPFHLEDRRGIKKPRHIDNPVHDLKVVQRLIARRVLAAWRPPHGMFGAVRGCTVRDNAQVHAGSRVLVTIDIEQCFPSISDKRVYDAIKLFVVSREVAELLTRLTTANHHLPQGAPTSPVLANMVMLRAFEEIQARAQRIGVRVSSWLDDFAFSGTRAREAIGFAYDAFGKLGLRISRKKTYIFRSDLEAQEVTGLVLNRTASLGRERIREFRRAIAAARVEDVTEYQLQRVRGQRAFAGMVNERQAAALARRAVGLPEQGIPGGRPPSRFVLAPCTCALGRGMVRRIAQAHAA
jgi:RNA-directed DNA polymerase